MAISMKFHLILFVFVSSCVTSPSVIDKEEYKVSDPAFLFPYDMSSWTCSDYLDEMKRSGLLELLNDTLKFRPHKRQKDAALSELVSLPENMVPLERRQRPNWYVRVHGDVLPSLQELMKAASAEGLNIKVQSGYRNSVSQNFLWQSAVKKFKYDYKMAAYKTAPPCFSEHATGKAVDFALNSVSDAIENTAEHQWLKKNAQKFGWYQSFQAGNPGVSPTPMKPGIMPEAWHYRHKSL